MGANESKKPEIKIILAGKTGVGKSTTGNTILKKKIFPTASSPVSQTNVSVTGNGMVYDRRITVTDTPGIYDTSDEENIREKLIGALVDAAPGSFVLVIVLKVERYTLQEKEVEKKVLECFEGINFKQSLVLFTHGEQLEGQTIDEFVKKSQKLQEYVNKCGGRCHVIDSKYWKNSLWGYKSNRFQVKNLLDTIDKMSKENGCYTNDLLQFIGEEIDKEFKLTDPSLPQQERREKAKKNVFKKLLIKFAGVATGTLVGAIMGITVPVATLLAILKGVKNSATASYANIDKTAKGVEEETILEAAAAAIGATAGAASVGTAAAAATVAAVEAGGIAVGASAAAGAAAASASAGGIAVGATAAAAASAGGIAVGASAAASAGGIAVGATAAAGAASVEAGVAAGAAAAGATAAAAGGAVTVEAGVAAGAGIGAAAGSGIAVGAVLGAAALAGTIGGGITGYKAVDEVDSVFDAIKTAAKANYKNVKEVVKKAEELPTTVQKKLGKRIQEGKSLEFLLSEQYNK